MARSPPAASSPTRATSDVGDPSPSPPGRHPRPSGRGGMLTRSATAESHSAPPSTTRPSPGGARLNATAGSAGAPARSARDQEPGREQRPQSSAPSRATRRRRPPTTTRSLRSPPPPLSAPSTAPAVDASTLRTGTRASVRLSVRGGGTGTVLPTPTGIG